MGELFMKYPIGNAIEHEGKVCRILGYETYNNRQILVCVAGDEECRIDVEEMKQWEAAPAYLLSKTWFV